MCGSRPETLITLTRIAQRRRVGASNAESRRSDRIFPNHQARCALLIPLRFEFANEFRLPPAERGTSRRSATRAPIRWTAVPPSAAFRPRGVTPKRGNNVASPRGADNHPYPAKNWTGRTTAPAGAHFQDAGPNRSPAERRRIAEIESIKYERTPRAPVIRNRRRRYVIITKGRAARMTSTRTAQFFFGSDLARRTCCKPSRLVLVASPPYRRVTHRVEGGSQPKGPG